MTRTSDLISAIYAATLLPEDFNRKFDDLDKLLFEDAPVAGQGSNMLEPDTIAHIGNARSIQKRIGRGLPFEEQLAGIIEAVPNPSYLITQRGTVTAANAMATARHVHKPARLEDCIEDEGVRRRIGEFVSRDKTGRLLAVTGHDRQRPDGGPTSVLLKRVDPALLPPNTDQLFLLSIVDMGFDATAIALFRDAFALTEAESQVAALLASGMRLSDIAEERQVSIDTVRTQVKTIKNKTSVADIPALVRLMFGFNAGALAPTSRATPAERMSTGPLRARKRVRLRDGRQLDYLEQGAPDGEAILLFHNIPYGVELPAAAIAAAHARGLRIIAPFRPGFGLSDAVADRGDKLLTRVANDAQELLDQLGIREVVALSHSTGAPYALRFARLHPRTVTKLIGVSQPPAWRDEWLAGLPQRQRFMLRLSRHAPQLLPVVIWAMLAVMESNRASDFVIYNCRDGAADSRATENQETVDLIAKGSVDAVRTTFDGLIAAIDIIMLDCTEEANAAPHKFHLLHGADDRIIDPSWTRTFAKAVPGTTVDMVEGAGQLLFYSHWQRVLDAVASNRSGAGQRVA